MSDPSRQPSGSSSATQPNDGAPFNRATPPTDATAPTAGRPLRGMASLRGAASLRGNLARGASLSSSASMVPSRSSYASPATGAAGSAGPGSGVRMQFRPVMPQRRKASASPGPQTAAAEFTSASPLSAPYSSGSGPRGGNRGRGRGGARPARSQVQMTASGPFALGPSARSDSKKVAPIGPGGSSLTPAASADPSRNITPTRSDTDRASYRNPDKLKDAEQYSDPEDGGVEIVDIDQVHVLDEHAPRALPRVAEKQSKKDKQKAASARQKKLEDRALKEEGDLSLDAPIRVKSEDEDVTMGDVHPSTDAALNGSRSSRAISTASVTPQPEDEPKVNTADALDLSESEGEELMDDLVDDFVFHGDDGVNPENRLYLFQFPQLFPKFKAPRKSELALDENSGETSKRRSVSFAEGTTGGAGQARPSSVKHEAARSSEVDDDESDESDVEDDNKKRASKTSAGSGQEGLVGKLDVYRDGRVFLRFGELVMEVTGGSQSTFLQQVMLLDPTNKSATALGELHRKFIVSPELDCMLDDISLYDEEQRIKAEAVKREREKKQEAERLKYGGSAASFHSIGGR